MILVIAGEAVLVMQGERGKTAIECNVKGTNFLEGKSRERRSVPNCKHALIIRILPRTVAWKS